jgi:hypothetical protein
MAFSLLGIGKFCNLIQNYVPTEASLLEAERLLSCNDLNDMEHRRMMFYFAAKARLEHWKGDFSQAFAFAQVANNYAREGNYVEGRYLREYERELDSLKQNTECVSDDTFTFNRPILYTDNTELSDVTTIRRRNNRFQNTRMSSDSSFKDQIPRLASKANDFCKSTVGVRSS